jgi:hypothetical protein
MVTGNYCVITELEMDTIFKPEKNWVKEYSGFHNEVVYSKISKRKPWLQIRVYSSINKNDGISAGSGNDSIKVCVINIKTDRGVIKTKRINRVPKWDDRLRNRVEEVWNEMINK